MDKLTPILGKLNLYHNRPKACNESELVATQESRAASEKAAVGYQHLILGIYGRGDPICDAICDAIICDNNICDKICDVICGGVCDQICDSICDKICDQICDAICDCVKL